MHTEYEYVLTFLGMSKGNQRNMLHMASTKIATPKLRHRFTSITGNSQHWKSASCQCMRATGASAIVTAELIRIDRVRVHCVAPLSIAESPDSHHQRIFRVLQ